MKKIILSICQNKTWGKLLSNFDNGNMQKACIQPAQRAPCKTGLTVLIPASVASMG